MRSRCCMRSLCTFRRNASKYPSSAYSCSVLLTKSESSIRACGAPGYCVRVERLLLVISVGCRKETVFIDESIGECSSLEEVDEGRRSYGVCGFAGIHFRAFTC